MSLTPGTRIGPYDITGTLGAGGMGEVYRARDARLARDVALKVLPDTFADDPDRLARFEREAQVLAALKHPNIGAIYGLEEQSPDVGRVPPSNVSPGAGGPAVRALVLELIEGDTLADRIARGAIPVDEALAIAKQIAEALEAAHEQGIIHRDLKPANIKVSADGVVKVLDFGLAKLTTPEDVGRGPRSGPAGGELLSQSPTLTSPAMMTGVGVILGTAAYMAPEQARGKAADKRADIWAFGCVLYEMLTGKRAFDGDDLAETLESVMAREPDWSVLTKDVPFAIRIVLRRSLEKDPRRRFADIAAAVALIEEAPALAAVSALRDAPARAPRRRMLLTHGATAAVVALVGAGATSLLMRPAGLRVVRSEIVTAAPYALSQTSDSDVAITPDGSHIIYSGTNQLLMRAIDRLEPQVLPTQATPRNVFVSPDGQWIGFFDQTSFLYKVAITGGAPVTIARNGNLPRGGTWGPDDAVVYATTASTGLLRVPAGGGEPTVLTNPDRDAGEADHLWPEFLPGRNGLLFTITSVSGGLDNAQIAVLDLATGTYKVVVRGGHHARYVPSGHLVYGASGALRAVAFDLARREPVGTPVPVPDRVLMGASGSVDAAIAGDGTLVYVPGRPGDGAARSLVWVTRDGREEPVPAPPRQYDSFALSPDGSRLAVQISDQQLDVWVWEFTRRTLTRLTFSQENDYDPIWSPDGSRIAWVRGGSALVWRAANGTGAEEHLAAANALPTSFSPDGKQLIVTLHGDIALVSADARGEVTPLVRTMFTEGNGHLSPDGRWLAYQSNESGQDEIYVQPFPDLASGRWQVSPAGGTEPAWARNGRELFYLDRAGALVTVPVQTAPTFSAGHPATLFEAPYYPVSGTRRYEVTADGRRFLFIKNAEDAPGAAPPPRLVIVQNWLEELKRLVPVN